MPPLSPAQRLQGAGAPVGRNRWDCPCGAHGLAQNAAAACSAGIRHFLDAHDGRRGPTAPRPAPRPPAACSLVFTYAGADTWAGRCDCGRWQLDAAPTLERVEHAHRLHTLEAAA